MEAEKALADAHRLISSGDRVEALSHLRRVGLDAQIPPRLLYEWGCVHADCGDRDGARAWWQRAVSSDRGGPIDPRAANELAVNMLRVGDLNGALALIELALDLAPQLVAAWINRGIALAGLGDAAAGQSAFEHALALEPDNTEALRNLVSALDDQGKRSQAEAALDRYLRAAPNAADAIFLRGIERLRRGELTHGWPDYEQRWARLGSPRRLKGVPLWSGDTLAGRRILVIDEQGLGEQLTFASCIPSLVERGAQVTLRCAPKLKQLFADSFAGVEVVAAGADDGQLSRRRFEFQISMGSLPGLVWPSWDCFAPPRPLLRPTPLRQRHWREQVERLGPGLKVGLSWQGGSSLSGARLRSIDLAKCDRLLAMPGIHFVSLQYHDCLHEIAATERRTGRRLHHWPEALGDYAETAALVSTLDVVISVATALVRLCNAIEKDVWVLVPVSADWVYQRDGATTPWLPRARLFRQEAAMQWETELDCVAAHLRELAASRSEPPS